MKKFYKEQYYVDSIIFNLDGILIDTSHECARAWKSVLAETPPLSLIAISLTLQASHEIKSLTIKFVRKESFFFQK